MNDNTLVWFGLHFGKRLAEVPHSYWLHLYDIGLLKGALKEWVEYEVPVLRFEKERKNALTINADSHIIRHKEVA